MLYLGSDPASNMRMLQAGSDPKYNMFDAGSDPTYNILAMRLAVVAGPLSDCVRSRIVIAAFFVRKLPTVSVVRSASAAADHFVRRIATGAAPRRCSSFDHNN
jgi:hypothetical protein